MATFFEEMGSDPADVADYTPAAAPVVSRMLELSTAHVPDAKAFSEHVYGAAWTMYPDGALVLSENPEVREGPDWLLAIKAHAVDLGCRWILFDVEGPIDPALPFWKW